MSLLLVAVILVAIMGAFLAVMAFFRGSSEVADSAKTIANMAKAHAALEQFASVSSRLPCPANAALNDGLENRTALSAICNSPTGTLPWNTIGLRREDSIDSWGWSISYRVYTNAPFANGSLTQDNGASMVKCDLVEPTPAGRTPIMGNAGGLCRDTDDTTVQQFLTGTGLPAEVKGVQVTDYGVVYNDVAYVLVSHGPSGLGGFTATGIQVMPLPANAAESNNTLAAGPFVAQASMTRQIAPGDAAYFDDVISYRRLPDFVQRANLVAREWPEPVPLASVIFDTPTLTAALGAAPAADTGQDTINFVGATASGTGLGGGATNIAFDTSGGADSIGVVGGIALAGPTGGITGYNAIGEQVRIDLTQKAQKFAITLDHFATYSTFPLLGADTYTERVEFKFFEDGVLKATVTASSCQSVAGGPNASAGLGSLSIDIGAGLLFNRVDVRPISTTANAAAPTTVFISAIATCPGSLGSCVTSLDTGPYPGGNRC